MKVLSRNDISNKLALFARIEERSARSIRARWVNRNPKPEEIAAVAEHERRATEYRNEEDRYRLTASVCGDRCLSITIR